MAATGPRQQDHNPSDARHSRPVSGVAVAVLQLPAQCTLPHAVALRASLLAALGGDADLHLDAGCVEAVDTAALQLLAAFIIELRQQGRRVQWQQVSAPLHAAAKRLGLLQTLGMQARATLP